MNAPLLVTLAGIAVTAIGLAWLLVMHARGKINLVDTVTEPDKDGERRASLRKIGFPMSRFEENDLAAMDGCTFDIDSAVMELSPQILQRIEREGKRVPTYYFATAYELPGAKGSAKDEDVDGDEDDDDEKETKPAASSAEAKLEKFVRAALAKIDEPIALKELTKALAKKFAEDDDVDDMVDKLTLAWCGELEGVVVDKKAKTVALEE